MCIWARDPANAKAIQFDIRFGGLGEILGFPSNVWIQSRARGSPTTGGETIYKQGVLQQRNAACVFGTKCTRFIGPSILQIVTPIANYSSGGSASRMSTESETVLAHVPVTGNYTTYMFYSHSVEMIPIGTTQGGMQINNVSFRLKLVGRDTYYNYIDGNVAPNYGLLEMDDIGGQKSSLSLNGEGFQVCVRFYIDDGTD